MEEEERYLTDNEIEVGSEELMKSSAKLWYSVPMLGLYNFGTNQSTMISKHLISTIVQYISTQVSVAFSA